MTDDSQESMTPGRFAAPFHRWTGLLLLVTIIAYAWVVVRTAWCSDDSYITMRTVDNFLHGYGLRWNVDERVQSYTHPLWMLLLAGCHAITREHFLTLIGMSVTLSCVAAVLAGAGIASNRWLGIAGVATLTLCPSFTDFSTSGLENPLTHLLLALFVFVYLREPWSDRTVLRLSLLTFLAASNRMDTLLLLFPALVYALLRVRTRRACLLAGVGSLPFAGWLLFSLVYYGFLFPNTAYAKLGAGIPPAALWTQGCWYVLYTLQRDPLTAITILFGLSIACTQKKQTLLPLAIGVVLYLLYVVRIGGDFMGGRFFSAPLFLCLLFLIQSPLLARPRCLAAWCGALLVTGFTGSSLWTNLGVDFTGPSDTSGICHQIMDERAHHRHYSSLEHWWEHPNTPDPTKANIAHSRPKTESYIPVYPTPNDTQSGADIPVCSPQPPNNDHITEAAFSVGFHGFFSGPDVYIIDRLALCDPFLARLPAIPRTDWRIGHFERALPDGYLETRTSGTMQIRDPDLARQCATIDCITRGPLFSLERWKAILHVNLGR